MIPFFINKGDKKMQNVVIRAKIKSAHLRYGDVAEYLGTTPQYLSRIMAKELNPVWKFRILAAVETLKEEGKGKNEKK